MSDPLNRPLTPKELEELKDKRDLEKALREVDEQHTKRIEEPSKWFGRLLILLLLAIFFDTTGWWTAFLSGRFYAAFATLLQILETTAIMGMAGLAVYGSIEAYKLQEAKKKVARDHKG